MILNTTQCNTYKIIHVLNYFSKFTNHCKKLYDNKNAKSIPVRRLNIKTVLN